MSLSIRQNEILSLARQDGKVTVEGLARHFDVTLQTIRRDLSDLADAGRLDRVHGGAVLPSGTTNIAYEDRRALNATAKSAIAAVCGRHIPNGASLFLNIGTTTEAVARELLSHRDLLVVTNNMNVALTLTANPDCQVILTGGQLRRADGGLIGPQTINTIVQFKFDFAVIGCSALDTDGDILDFDVAEVGVSRAILQHARSTYLVADRAKLDRKAPARIASLADLDGVFTDHPLPSDLDRLCRDWGTPVHVAQA